MLLMGSSLMEAWNEFAYTDPVPIEEITDDPEFLAFLGSGHVYEVSRKVSDALLPLMHTKYTGGFTYNGTEYGIEGYIADVQQLHIDGKRYWKFPEGAEELCAMLRIKMTIEAVCLREKERWERAHERK